RPTHPLVAARFLTAKVIATMGLRPVAGCHSTLLPFVWGPLRLPGTSRAARGHHGGPRGAPGNLNHDEFRRGQRRQANLTDHLSRFPLLQGIELRVALDKETLLRGHSLQSTALEELVAKARHPFPRPIPEGRMVLLERHVVHVVLDPSHQGQEDPANVHMSPFPMPAQGPGSPYAYAAAGEA